MKKRSRWLWAAAVALAVLGAAETALGARIYLKARAAETLLALAWQRSLATGSPVRPWPSADTAPIARLTVPRLGVHRIVLAGASGSAMAFAAGHLAGTARPGEAGNAVVAGHRDTHFRFLEQLEAGDAISVESLADRRTYRVVSMEVVDEGDLGPLAPSAEPRLTLITCYPFGALVPGGPLRYVVTAVEAESPGRPRRGDQPKAAA